MRSAFFGTYLEETGVVNDSSLKDCNVFGASMVIGSKIEAKNAPVENIAKAIEAFATFIAPKNVIQCKAITIPARLSFTNDVLVIFMSICFSLMYKNINPYYDKIRNEEHMKLEDTVKQVLETNKNDKSDDGEGLDAVQPKAVKKKFKDRKDKDIDNDGDTDDSDKFLHKKRKAISKAVAADKKEQKTYSKLYSHVKNLMSK